MPSVIVWDLETIPDLEGYARANGLSGLSSEQVREDLGEKFPKHIYHSIVCIGAVIARSGGDGWVVQALGAPASFAGHSNTFQILALKNKQIRCRARNFSSYLFNPQETLSRHPASQWQVHCVHSLSLTIDLA